MRFHATSRWRFVEHRDAVAHVVERDAEFVLALADFVQQPRVLHRDHRLGREILQQRDLLVRERAHLVTAGDNHAEERVVLAAEAHASSVRAPPMSTRCASLASPAGKRPPPSYQQI